MRKSKFSEAQIFKFSQEQESGLTVEEISRKHSITTATFYRWKNKYSGMDLNQAKKLKAMEDELRQYKQMYSELARENFILKDVIEKKL